MANGPLSAILQERISPEMQGRVFSLVGAGANAISPLATLLSGPLAEVLGELGLSAREFSKASDIPQSTLYKILSGHREPNISTLRQIVKTIRQLEGSEGNFIAIIAARPIPGVVGRHPVRQGLRRRPADRLHQHRRRSAAKCRAGALDLRAGAGQGGL